MPFYRSPYHKPGDFSFAERENLMALRATRPTPENERTLQADQTFSP